MRIHKIIIGILVALPLLASCGSEDDLTPSGADINGFAPLEGDNSQTAQIRNAFYQATGSYLLFNDTLVSQSTNGQPELFDINYALVGSSSVDTYDYHYTYITDAASQQKAADALRTYLVSKLGKATPFSFLLVDDIYYNSYGRKKHATYLLGTRGYAISTGSGEMYDDPKSYVNDMLADIAYDRFNRQSSTVTDAFYSYSKEYYGQDVADDEKDIENVEYTHGLMEKFEGWDEGFYYYPYETRDVKDYIAAVLSMTREEFVEKYGSYAIMVDKYDAMRTILTNIGFNLDASKGASK